MDPDAPKRRGVPRQVDVLARACPCLAGAVLTGIALMSAWGVIGRALTGKPIQGDFEVVRIGCAIAVALLLPPSQLRVGNIIVDFFTLRASMPPAPW